MIRHRLLSLVSYTFEAKRSIAAGVHLSLEFLGGVGEVGVLQPPALRKSTWHSMRYTLERTGGKRWQDMMD